MKTLKQLVIAFAFTGLSVSGAQAQVYDYDKFAYYDTAVGDNPEHHTHHFILSNEEFTIVTDGYKISRINEDGALEFGMRYKLESGEDFIPIDITCVNEKIILLGRYDITEGEGPKEYIYSIVSLNPDQSTNWEHFYRNECDKIVESPDQDIMVAAITESGKYQLMEVAAADGSVLDNHEYNLSYYSEDAHQTYVPTDLSAFERSGIHYFAVGTCYYYGNKISMTIHTDVGSMITTAKNQRTNNQEIFIVDIEPDGYGNFYFAGNIYNGSNLLIGKIGSNHNVIWEKKLTWDLSIGAIYLKEHDHILQESTYEHYTDERYRKLISLLVCIDDENNTPSYRYDDINRPLIIQFDNGGNLIRQAKLNADDGYTKESLHRLSSNALTFYTVKRHDGFTSIMLRHRLNVFLENCNLVDFEISSQSQEPSTRNVEVSPAEQGYEDAPQEYHAYQIQPWHEKLCEGETIYPRRGPALAGQKTENGSAFKMYPNPSNGTVFIELANENTQVEIFDLTGKKISMDSSNQGNILTLSNLKAGTYVVRIKNNENVRVEKLIIQ